MPISTGGSASKANYFLLRASFERGNSLISLFHDLKKKEVIFQMQGQITTVVEDPFLLQQ